MVRGEDEDESRNTLDSLTNQLRKCEQSETSMDKIDRHQLLADVLKPIQGFDKATYISMIMTLVSIVLWFVDVGSDIYAAYEYFTDKQLVYAIYTISLVVFAQTTLVVTAYVNDVHVCHHTDIRHKFRRLFLCIPVLSFERYRAFYRLKHSEDDGGSIHDIRHNQDKMKLLTSKYQLDQLQRTEVFCEDVPEFLLQLYIIYTTGITTWTQYTTIISSLISIVQFYTDYATPPIEDQKKENQIPYIHIINYFVSIVNRLLCLSLAVSRKKGDRLVHSQHSLWTHIRGFCGIHRDVA